MMRPRTAIAVAAIVAFGGSTGQAGETLECVVVQINDQIVTLSELNDRRKAVLDDLYRLRLAETELTKRMELAKTSLLPSLIEETLLLQKAKNVGLSIGDEEVERVIRDIMTKSQIPDQAALQRQLESEGLTLARVRDNIRRASLIEKLKSFEIASKVVITDEEAQRYYDQHMDEFQLPELVRMRQIVLLTEGRPEDEIRQQIEELSAMIANGADFAELATLFSHAPNAEHGGDLGFVRTDELSGDIAAVTTELAVGEVSKPLKADFGYHLLKLVERKPVAHRTYEDARKEITFRIQQGRFDEKMDEYVKALREQAYVREFPGCVG